MEEKEIKDEVLDIIQVNGIKFIVFNFENLKSSYTFSITPTLLILSILFTFTSIGTTYLESFRTQAKEAAELEEVLKDEDSPFLFLVDPSQRLKNKYFSSALTYVFSENETYSTNPYIDILKKYTNPGTEDEKTKVSISLKFSGLSRCTMSPPVYRGNLFALLVVIILPCSKKVKTAKIGIKIQ